MRLRPVLPSPDPQQAFVVSLERGLRRCQAVGARVLVAVSGGADSVALLRGLLMLRESLGLSLQAAHLNHQLRGTDSDADAAWVSSLCERLKIPCDVGSVAVTALAKQTACGLEETARDARYDFLQSTAQSRGCDVIAAAHTADDQAETVLHHILRGTGLSGLRGMNWSRELVREAAPTLRLIRPMLAIWRRDVEAYLSELSQDFRIDASNRDTSLTRNRLRHDLLPLLERDFNSQTREHLCRLAEQAADWEQAARHAADELLRIGLLDQSPTSARLRCDPLAAQPRHIVREMFVRLWHRQNWTRPLMTFAHWDGLAEMAQTGEPASLNLPGEFIARRRDQLLAIECHADRVAGRAVL